MEAIPIGSPVVGFRDEYLLLEDINSDGLYDLVLEQTGRSGELDYWINLGRPGFGEQRTITGLPPHISNTTIRLADMNGNGTTDIVWSSPFADASLKYRFLDLSAGVQPNLLKLIDNGLGRRIHIEYKSSTAYYLEAEESGSPWAARLPFPMALVSRMIVTTGLDLDGVPGKDQYVSRYVYRDAYYDDREKEFRGFARVEKVEQGDATAPSLVTQYTFHTGAPDGADNDDDGQTDERASDGSEEAESLKGRVLMTQSESEGGVVYRRGTNSWSIRNLTVGM